MSWKPMSASRLLWVCVTLFFASIFPDGGVLLSSGLAAQAGPLASQNETADRSSSSQTDPALVREIQQLLFDKGFDPGPLDGKMGRATARAISDYQAAEGLAADGRISPELLVRLRRSTGNNGAASPPESAETIGPMGEVSPLSGGAEGAPLPGTVWRFVDETGSEFSLEFIYGGGVKGVLYEKFWSWRQVGGVVEISYDNGMGLAVMRSGKSTGPDTMEGRAVSSRGKDWAWKAERIIPKADFSEDAKSASEKPPAPPEEPQGVAETRELQEGTPGTSDVSGESAQPPEPRDEALATGLNKQVSAPAADRIATELGLEKPSNIIGTATAPIVESATVVPDDDKVSATRIASSEQASPVLDKEEGLPDEKPREPRIYGKASSDGRTVIIARQESWVEITDDEGGILFSRVLRKGDSYRVPAGQGATMVTGNAGGLEIVVDGQPVPDLGPIGAVRRGVALDPELLKSGTAQPSVRSISTKP